MSNVFESIRWGSVLLTVALIGLFGLLYRVCLVPLERRLGSEAKRSKVLQVHLQSTRGLEGLVSDFLLASAGGAVSNNEMASILKKIEDQIALVQVDPEVVQALEQFITTARGMMAAQSARGSSAPTPTQMANLEQAYGRFCSTSMRVTEKLAIAKA
ncbi:hypothetical protein [Acidovorax delafieldii]|uniref:hypothetical protein n=1 Tax=Acidovorax delafieldii TaxID=47920 RepID=UPI003ED01E5F